MAGSEPRVVISLAFALSALLALVVSVLRIPGVPAAPLAIVLLVAALLIYKPRFSWPGLLAGLLLVILFIPIKRYVLPGGLPFQLEPYRAVVGFLLAGWVLSLLADVRLRARASGLEGPLLAISFTAAASLAVNGERFMDAQSDVVKALSFFVSFLLVFYLVTTVIGTFRDVEYLVKVLVVGGAVIAFLALIEFRSGFNPYDRLAEFVPILELEEETELGRSGRFRAFGPAQHPIALGAAMVILLPLAFYVARAARSRLWWAPVLLITLGSLATLSRTSVVMLVVVGAVFLWLRPRETKRLWPAAVVLVVVTHFLLPGTLGTMFEGFFPKGGLIAQQQRTAGSCDANARLNDIGPAIDEASKKPLFGYGYATRITGDDDEGKNACVLDNQWLESQIETGLLGTLAWAWLFVRFIRRASREAKADLSDRGWLLASLAASVTAFGIGMFFFDAFAFIQVTLLLFILLGFGSALLREERAIRVARLAPARAPAAG